MREAVIECYWSRSCEVRFSLSFSWLFLNGSSRASNNRGNFYFVCTHCCHDLLCFNRPFLIIKRDNFSGCGVALPSCVSPFSAYCSLISGLGMERIHYIQKEYSS